MASVPISDEAPLSQTFLLNFYISFRRYPFSTILVLIVLRFLFRRYVSTLRKYPGPFLASGTRLYTLYITWRGRTHEDHIALHRKYGPIVRIQPNQLSFASPEAARQILAPGKGFHKTDFYWVFPPYGNPDIFTETREEVHAIKKRFVTQPYSLSSIQTLTPWIAQTITTLCRKLDRHAENKVGQPIDLGNFLHWFAFDVLGEVAFSKSFGFLDEEKDIEGAIQFIDTVQVYDGVVGQVPWLDYFLRRSPIWDYLPGVTPLGDNHITRTALRQMAARENGTAVIDRRDLLSQFFEAHEKDPEKFSKDSVFAVAHGAMFAGSDSTASTMQTFMWNVLNNKVVYEKLMKEILHADMAGRLSEIVEWKESQNSLPYFQACLKEAMRIGPAVGVAICRKVPGLGVEIDGEYVAGGTEVAVNAWVLHRDKEIFGEDADLYRPERWMVEEGNEKAEARVKRMERYMFQVSPINCCQISMLTCGTSSVEARMYALADILLFLR